MSILKKAAGITGLLLVIIGYLLLWSSSPDAELTEVVPRVWTAITLTLFGNLVLSICIFKKLR